MFKSFENITVTVTADPDSIGTLEFDTYSVILEALALYKESLMPKNEFEISQTTIKSLLITMAMDDMKR